MSLHSFQEKLQTVAEERSYDNTLKHDILGVDGGHKTSDERPKCCGMFDTLPVGDYCRCDTSGVTRK